MSDTQSSAGEPNTTEVLLDALKRAAAAHGVHEAKELGGVYDKETASRYIRAGARMVLSGSDHTYLLAGAKERAEVLRGAV